MRIVAVFLCVMLAAGRLMAEPITCFFVTEENSRTVQTTLIGPLGPRPEWIAQTLEVSSAWTVPGLGQWVGVAAARDDVRVAEISIAAFRWHGTPGLGIRIVAAPVMDALDAGFARSRSGRPAAPTPVWGELMVDGRRVLAGVMQPRAYPDGDFLEMALGFLNRPDGAAEFGVTRQVERLALDLMSATESVTLTLYSAKPTLLQRAQPLARFNFVAGTFASGREWAADIMAGATREFSLGCPRHRRSSG